MSTRTRRDRLKAEMAEEIKAAARRIVENEGPDALTLAAVARRVEVTPAALYRYYCDLGDLVRHVASDLVAEIVATQRAAADREPPEDVAARLMASTRAFRAWCISHRNAFCLLFGTPTAAIGDVYKDMTNLWVRDLAQVWGPLFVQLWAERPFPILADEEIDSALRIQLEAYRTDVSVDLPLGTLVVFLSCWRSIYGAVALEVFEHFTPTITNHEPMFELMLADLFTRLGLAREYQPPHLSRR